MGRAFFKSVTALTLFVCVGSALIAGGAPADSAIVGAVGAPGPSTATSSAARQGPFAVILVIDALRFDEIDLARMPNLARLVAGGTQYINAWVGQLPSVTETSHATIGTGVLPARHLVLGDTWRVPGKDAMSPDLLNAQLDRTGYIGNFIRQTGSPSIASMVHQRFPGSIVVGLSGHKIYAADGLGAGRADFVAFGGLDQRRHFVPLAIPGRAPGVSILDSPQLDLPSYPGYPRTLGTEDAWATTLSLKFLFKYHPRLMMINLPEVDVTGHLVGTNPAVIQPLLQNIDRQIGRLVAAYGRAGLLSQTYWVITADHAMVPGLHTVNIGSVESVIARAGGKALYVGHGDYCPIWLKNVTAVPRVAAALAQARIPYVAAVYAKNSYGRYVLASSASRLADPAVQQAYQDLLSSFDSAESPDIVLLYAENTMTMTPKYLQIGRKADHGGATWGAQHIPLVLAGPGIKQAYTSGYPARLVDLAPTVETLLGIRPAGQDGVPLADAMLQPPSWAAAAQLQQIRLAADVAALQHEAQAELSAGR